MRIFCMLFTEYHKVIFNYIMCTYYPYIKFCLISLEKKINKKIKPLINK